MTSPAPPPPLDPRFGKLVSLMQSTSHEAERAAARQKAEDIAAAAGMSFERAFALFEYERVRSADPHNPFAGFDEWREIQEPGHMARLRAETAERRRLWPERRAAVLRRYGSVEAVLEPCRRETLILAAVKPWRQARNPPWQRWTESLDGWRSTWEAPPPAVRDAVMTAYPMPVAFPHAKAEMDYWQARNEDIEHALSEDGSELGQHGLDLAARARWAMVRDLARRDLRVDNLPDLVERFRMYRESEATDRLVEDSIFRDLQAIAEALIRGRK